MFDNRQYVHTDSLDTAIQARKIKKILFNLSKQAFSDIKPFRLKYYQCINESLHNPELAGKNLDKSIVLCKSKLQKVQKYIEDTNQHAKIKVQRCIKSKRLWSRNFSKDLETEETGTWECLNRYHRRYLYYYPPIRDNQFNQ
jgi:hypothetical protein